MGDTIRDEGYAADPDEAAFQRLAEGLAALRRDTGRLREPADPASIPQVDSQAIADALAEMQRRIDAVAARVSAAGDSTPILAALAAVEEKIGKLTAGLDRFVERSALTEALDKANGKVDSLAARVDARLNRLQEIQAELSARPKPAGSVAATRPGSSRLGGHVPALLLLAVMLIAAGGALALLRPDLVKPDWVRREWAEPARDTVSRWLRLGRLQSGPPPAQMAAVAPAKTAGPEGAAGALKAEVPAGAAAMPENLAAVDANPETAALPAPEQRPPEGSALAPADPAAADAANAPAGADTAVAAAPPPSPAVVQPVPQPVRAAPTRGSIVLGARADVWLMVQDGDGRTLLARILHDGETWKVPDVPGLRLSTGNAGATVVLIDGVASTPLGGSGGVRRDILLDTLSAATAAAPAQTPAQTSPGKRRPANAPSASPDHSGAEKPSATASR